MEEAVEEREEEEEKREGEERGEKKQGDGREISFKKNKPGQP